MSGQRSLRQVTNPGTACVPADGWPACRRARGALAALTCGLLLGTATAQDAPAAPHGEPGAAPHAAPSAPAADDAAPASRDALPEGWPAWPPTKASPDGKPGAFQVMLPVGKDRHALNVTVVLPEAMPQGEGRLPVVIALPPGAGNAQMCAVVRELYWDAEARARGYLLLVPEVLGQSLATDAKDVAAALFGWLDAKVPYDKDRVTLAGVSNGGMGAFHMVLAAPERFAALLVLPGGHEGAPEVFAALRSLPVRMLVGGKDKQWKGLCERNLGELQAQGVDAELIVVPDQEHVIQVPGANLFSWIDEHGTRAPAASATKPADAHANAAEPARPGAR